MLSSRQFLSLKGVPHLQDTQWTQINDLILKILQSTEFRHIYIRIPFFEDMVADYTSTRNCM